MLRKNWLKYTRKLSVKTITSKLSIMLDVILRKYLV